MREALVSPKAAARVIAMHVLGGPGSGNFGHAGRPGLVGGSSDDGVFSERLTHEVTNVEDKRLFVSSKLKYENWLDAADPNKEKVAATFDLNHEDKSVYLNRMDVSSKGRGYGPETLQAVLLHLRARGFKTAKGYIEHNNLASQSMMMKLGAVVERRNEHGSYWRIDLTTAQTRALSEQGSTPLHQAADAHVKDLAVAVRFAFAVAHKQVNGMRVLGGPGSGNFGHEGRPGQEGGSAPTEVGFHGTADKFVSSILKHGLRPDDQGRVFVTPELERAKSYAIGAGENRGVQSGIVLEIRIPKEHAQKFEAINSRRGLPSRYIYRGTVKPEWIRVHSKNIKGEWRTLSAADLVFYVGVSESDFRAAADFDPDPILSTLSRELTKVLPGALTRCAVEGARVAATGLRALGGPGSGNFGHEGRPGLVGGSGDGDSEISVSKGSRYDFMTDGDDSAGNGLVFSLPDRRGELSLALKYTSYGWAEKNKQSYGSLNSLPEDVADVFTVRVTTEHQGDGFRLYKAALEHVKKLGLRGISSWPPLRSREANRFWKSLAVHGAVVEHENGWDILTDIPLRAAESFRAAKKSVQFNAINKRATAWAKKHAAEMVTDITETSRKRIKAAIANLLEGESYRSILDKIAKAVGDDDRAMLIARHETMSAVSAGQREAWAQAVEDDLLTGREKRVWIATPVGACPVCEKLDGKTAKLGGAYPGGSLGPPEHVACRCTEGLQAGRALGGPGSGNFGHEGRPGLVGGSGPGNGDDISDADRAIGDELTTMWRASGKEHGIAVDKHGNVIGQSDGTDDSVDFPSSLNKQDPLLDARWHHNHPYETSLSTGDMIAFSDTPALHKIYAHTENTTYVATKVPDKERELYFAAKDVFPEKYKEALDRWFEHKNDDQLRAETRAAQHLAMQELHKRGLVIYSWAPRRIRKQ